MQSKHLKNVIAIPSVAEGKAISSGLPRRFAPRNDINVNPIIIFSSIIIISLLIRLLWLDKTSFFVNDQGRDLLVLYNFVNNQQLTLIGPATSLTGALGNIYFGPFYYYYLILFYLISSSPLFMIIIFPILFSVGLFLFSKIKSVDIWQKII